MGEKEKLEVDNGEDEEAPLIQIAECQIFLDQRFGDPKPQGLSCSYIRKFVRKIEILLHCVGLI